MKKSPRIAIIHDWLTIYGGAERVLGNIADCFPDAELFVAVDFLGEHPIRHKFKAVHTTFIQRLPGAKKWYWYYAALMPLAFEQLDLSEFDIIVSSSHAFAKGVIVHPHQLHVCYLHSPPRFIWDLQSDYLQRFGFKLGFKRFMASVVFHYLRHCDARSVHAVDFMVANSVYVKNRAMKCYRRDTDLIYPGVRVGDFQVGSQQRGQKGGHYLAGSFMNPFKRLDLIIKAFNQMPSRQLVVFGEGPQQDELKRMAGPNVSFVGKLSHADLVEQMQRARAFVFAPAEDFGIVMVEAQSAGTPVIAYGRGGARDIVQPIGGQGAPTGVFFDEQSAASLIQAVEQFEAQSALISSEACSTNAARFHEGHFIEQFRAYVMTRWHAFNA